MGLKASNCQFIGLLIIHVIKSADFSHNLLLQFYLCRPRPGQASFACVTQGPSYFSSWCTGLANTYLTLGANPFLIEYCVAKINLSSRRPGKTSTKM